MWPRVVTRPVGLFPPALSGANIVLPAKWLEGPRPHELSRESHSGLGLHQVIVVGRRVVDIGCPRGNFIPSNASCPAAPELVNGRTQVFSSGCSSGCTRRLWGRLLALVLWKGLRAALRRRGLLVSVECSKRHAQACLPLSPAQPRSCGEGVAKQ